MRKLRVEEHTQVTFVTWFRWTYPRYADLLTLGSFGENVGERRMRRLKEMGLTPGYPDLVLYVAKPYEGFWKGGLFIEMKTQKGRVSETQKAIHEALSRQYVVRVARNFDEAQEHIIDYLEADWPQQTGNPGQLLDNKQVKP